MYTLVNTYAKPKQAYSQWQTIDAENETFQDLFNQYRSIVFVLEHPMLPDQVSLDAEEIRVDVGGTTLTVGQMLIANGDKTLPTSTKIPFLREHVARYEDVKKATYKVWLTDGVSSIDDQTPFGKTGLKLTRDNTDFEQFYKHIMVSVNGFFYPTDYDINGAFVKDCFQSGPITKADSVGLLSFENIGELTQIPITEDMLYKRNDETPYHQRVDIKLPIDHSDYTIAMVIGGYLHIAQDNLFIRTGTHTVSLNFDQLNFPNRYFESKRFMDLSSLPLTKSATNPEFVALSELDSDEVIKAYLTLPQSFIVLIKTQDISLERVYVSVNGKGLQSYSVGFKPDLPMFCGRGMLVNYWSQKQFGPWWSLFTNDNRLDNYLYQSVPADELDNIDNARYGAFPHWNHRPAPAYMLKIKTTSIWD